LYPDLKTDVLIAPHHGSAKTSEKKFINNLKPKDLVCSCPASAIDKNQIIKHIEVNDCNLFYTGLNGSITVNINKSGTIDTSGFKIKRAVLK
jgi:beta-lactamase superfamily II metal-dependent hydrolase